MSNETSSVQSETLSADPQPVTGNAPGGAMPQKPTVTLEEALAQLAETKHAYEKLNHEHENASGELKRHRARIEKIDQAEKAAKEAELSEVEKANKRAVEAEQRIQQYQAQLVSAQVRLAAQTKGIIDPELAALAISNKLEYGDDGLPTNVDDALDKLVKEKPYLLVTKPAQTEPEAPPSQPSQTQTPALPAMNPGRSRISAPGSNPPGRIPRLSDPGVLVPPGTASKYQP